MSLEQLPDAATRSYVERRVAAAVDELAEDLRERLEAAIAVERVERKRGDRELDDRITTVHRIALRNLTDLLERRQGT